MDSIAENMLEVRNLKKYFNLGRSHGESQILKAVDDVSFAIPKGSTLGLVGESGCGKTTAGRTAIGVLPRTGGEIFYKGRELSGFSASEKKAFFRETQMIFQDPYASLDPRMKVLDIIAEGMDLQKMVKNSNERRDRVTELLQTVGLSREHAGRYIHEFSGGQRQRIGIARALAVNPEFIMCDEPISSLDVSVRAQIVNLLTALRNKSNLTYLFIAHDLSVVKYISDRIAVMYLGVIVESATPELLFAHPVHPYTRALLQAIPLPDPDVSRSRARIRLTGDVPSPLNIGPGCRFASRCSYAAERCRTEQPAMTEVESGHTAACHLLP